MADGKIRDNNHIIEAKSLLFLQSIFPVEWVQRKMEPDYGIDVDIELFDYESDVCVTLGEHVFLQVKGTTKPNYTQIKPAGKVLYTNKELDKMQISVLKFVVDVPLLKLVERMGSAVPVLLVVVDIYEQIAYYVCLNDYIHNVLKYRIDDYREYDNVTIYIPQENVLKPSVVSWYGKRTKLYGLFQELLTLADNVQYCDAKQKVDIMERNLKIIASSDAWGVCKQWSALEQIRQQLDAMLENNMISEIGKHMLEKIMHEGENVMEQTVQYGSENMMISALLCAQAVSCDAFLNQAQAVAAMFENNVRHMGLPTHINWVLSC